MYEHTSDHIIAQLFLLIVIVFYFLHMEMLWYMIFETQKCWYYWYKKEQKIKPLLVAGNPIKIIQLADDTVKHC